MWRRKTCMWRRKTRPGFCAFRARTRLCSNLAARAVFLTRSHFLMHWFSGSAHWNFNSRFVKLGPLPVTAVSFSPLFRFYSNSLNSFLHDDPASSNGLGAMCRQLCGSLWRFLGDYTVDVELFLQTVFWCFFWAVFPFSKVLSCSARWKLQQTDRPNWACSRWHYSFFLFFFSHEVRKRIPFRNGSTWDGHCSSSGTGAADVQRWCEDHVMILTLWLDLFCVVQSDSAVFDSEWHRISKRRQIFYLVGNFPEFSMVLSSRESSPIAGYSSDVDMRLLVRWIQEDSKLQNWVSL